MAEPTQSIIFVVDGPELETQSLILTASLARHHRVGAEVSLLAYVTEPTLATLDPATRAIYDLFGVQIVPLAKGAWAEPYPHGNKILAAAMPRPSERTIFLDTDMLCQAPITTIAPETPDEIFVVPEFRRTWGKNKNEWKAAYDFFDLPLPGERVILSDGKNSRSLPYFNAGFIGFSDLPLIGEDQTFGRLWLDTARKFDFECDVANKRPWLDQITLPLAMALRGLNCLVLPESYNFSIAKRDDLTPASTAQMIHYQKPGYFHVLPHAAETLTALRDATPEQHRASLDLLLTLHFDALPDGTTTDA